MTDIALVIIEEGDFACDMQMLGADLATDDGLKTALIISAFSDARADDDDALPNPGGDRRGWWGDAYAEVPGDRIGSKLWLLAREKQLPEVLIRAQGYAEAAFAWLIADSVAASVQVAAFFPNPQWLGLSVTVDRPTGQGRARFDFVWRNT
jgi:phage gp46-like protein